MSSSIGHRRTLVVTCLSTWWSLQFPSALLRLFVCCIISKSSFTNFIRNVSKASLKVPCKDLDLKEKSAERRAASDFHREWNQPHCGSLMDSVVLTSHIKWVEKFKYRFWVHWANQSDCIWTWNLDSNLVTCFATCWSKSMAWFARQKPLKFHDNSKAIIN